ncbi:hypothetical protein CFE70_000912 [Pyrenophora teres f. teres 0-1]
MEMRCEASMGLSCHAASGSPLILIFDKVEVTSRQRFLCQRSSGQRLEESGRIQAARGSCPPATMCAMANAPQLNDKHKLFKPGQTVVDLVAVNRTLPDGRVIGIDLIPAQPPRGVSTLQGNFLSPVIQEELRAYVRDPEMGRPTKQAPTMTGDGLTEEELDEIERGYIDMERHAHLEPEEPEMAEQPAEGGKHGNVSPTRLSLKERDVQNGRVVDIVLSDMSEPWEQTVGLHKKSLSDPYFRMMNTSGNAFRDHAGSMTGGHFLCKYYKGSEEKAFETRMKRLFAKESKEAYFVGLGRKETATKEHVLGD